jgi:hypothetical protein
MMKRRLKDFGLPLLYSPRSYRVTIITDLLEQNVPREDVRHMAAGHADARTTGLYDRHKINEGYCGEDLGSDSGR